MAARSRRGGGGNGLDAWPGYVDALSTLLMVLMFVLLVFVMAQAFESVVLANRNDQLTATNRNLTSERERNAALTGSVSRLHQDLAAGSAAQEALRRQLQALNAQTASTMAERDRLAALLKEVELAAAAAATMNRTLTARAESETARAESEAARADTAARLNSQLTATVSRLRGDAEAAEARAREMRAQVAELDRTVKADKETIEAKLSELARLAEQIRALTALRDQLEKEARTAAAATLTEEQKRRAAELLLEDEKKLADSTRARIALLTEETARLRRDLAVSEQARAASDRARTDSDRARADSERARAEEQVRAATLNDQLNLALAAQVEELRKYRSDFFGKLRAVLADKPGVAVVGDRFVFQSEVLFGISSADLTPTGKTQMAEFATSFRRIADEMPPDVSWLLRVDGHTDSVPVKSPRFRSNWELSAARAITVVKFLIERGIPPQRLAAAGFGENQPVDPANTPEARAKNRRIEMRLTDR